MENLNDLIWTDENDNKGNSTSGIDGLPMIEACMICLCLIDPSSGSGGSGGHDTAGNLYACKWDAPYTSFPCIAAP